MKKMTVLWVVVAMAMLQVPAAMAGKWGTYTNPRFGTKVDVPLNGFVADPPPQNGDGQSWTSNDGRGQISVYGSFIVVADTFPGYRRFMLDSAREDGLDITYSASKRGWFAYSGFQGNDIIYVKVVRSENCSSPVANHIYLQYPKDQRATYNPIVKQMAKSLSHSSLDVECD